MAKYFKLCAQGFDLSKDDAPVENNFKIDVHASGAKERIELNARIISCGKCIHIAKCNKDKDGLDYCRKNIIVNTEPLLSTKPDDTELTVSSKKI